MSPSTSATIALTGSGNPGRLQAISHIQVNRRLSLWTKRSRPSLRLVLKVVDLLPHDGHPQQKDDCPLRWIVDMVLWTAPFDSRYPMASVFFLVLFQSRFLNNDFLHLYRYDDLMNSWHSWICWLKKVFRLSSIKRKRHSFDDTSGHCFRKEWTGRLQGKDIARIVQSYGYFNWRTAFFGAGGGDWCFPWVPFRKCEGISFLHKKRQYIGGRLLGTA